MHTIPYLEFAKIYLVYDPSSNSTNNEDRSVEEFHAYWRDLVHKGVIKNVFDFERVFGEFKKQKGLL